MVKKACKSCKYYYYKSYVTVKSIEQLVKSECRRHAPTRKDDNLFPLVYPDDWCGEFELEESEE